MIKGLYPFLLGLGLAATVLATAGTVQAALGEGAGSAAADLKVLSSGRSSSEVRTGYTVRQVQADALTLREFISPAGIVFAVAWQGMIHPDLKPLLGSYHADYTTALEKASPRPGSRRLQVRAKNVVVEKWGQMRNLQGRAYVPDLIPPGVKIDEIE